MQTQRINQKVQIKSALILEVFKVNQQEIKEINSHLLLKLCRNIGKKEKINKTKAKQCTLIINDALVKLQEV